MPVVKKKFSLIIALLLGCHALVLVFSLLFSGFASFQKLGFNAASWAFAAAPLWSVSDDDACACENKPTTLPPTNTPAAKDPAMDSDCLTSHFKWAGEDVEFTRDTTTLGTYVSPDDNCIGYYSDPDVTTFPGPGN
jgi:hypothetical protein